jgi:hypothetical protein
MEVNFSKDFTTEVMRLTSISRLQIKKKGNEYANEKVIR